MSNNNLITPRKLSGFMELPPYKQIIFDNMLDSIKKVYKNNCFMPLDTPVLEYTDILLAKSGGEIDKEVYHFTKGDSDLCMRYDLTVPLARHVAMNADTISFPFKRYQIGKVFRGERPQKGRFREFYQCDADIIGLDNLPITADAECINLIHETFSVLNLDILIQISNRNVLFGYVEALGLKDKTQSVLTILDKLPKIGKENAFKELVSLEIDKEECDKLISISCLKGDFKDVLTEIKGLSDNLTFQRGVAELEELASYLEAYKIPKDKYILHLGIIRGQNYYTGTIFETLIPSHPEFGVVSAGGRYDNLAGYFTDKKLPGVGMSIGFTRLFDLLDTNNMLGEFPLSPTQALIIPLGNTINSCLELSTFFRSNKIRCEVNYDDRSFKAKLKDANRKGIPFVIIVGENEVANKIYTIKNMYEGVQETLSKEDCLERINTFLKK